MVLIYYIFSTLNLYLVAALFFLFIRVNSVEEIVCANPGWAKFGYLSSNRTMYNISEKVYFECTEHYTTVGKNFAICGPDGQWDTTAPPCFKDLAHNGKAIIKVLEETKEKKSQSISTEIQPNILTDGDRVTCVAIERKIETEVSIELDQVYDIDGIKLRYDVEGRFNINISISVVDEDRNVEERCNAIKGEMTRGGILIDCQKRLRGSIIKIEDGMTTGDIAICDIIAYKKEVASCGHPPGILHGHSIPHKGGQFEYECESGYELKGERHVTCVKGQWQLTAPSCELKVQAPLDCGKPEPIAGTLLSLQVNHTSGVPLATYTCTLGGSSYTVECQAGGNWGKVDVQCPIATPKIAKLRSSVLDTNHLLPVVAPATSVATAISHSVAFISMGAIIFFLTHLGWCSDFQI